MSSGPTDEKRKANSEQKERPLMALLYEDKTAVLRRCLFGDNSFNINRGKSFLQALGLTWGIAAIFGKKQAQFNGLRAPS